MNEPAPPAFRDSSVVVLVRGLGDSLETYWVERSEAVPYMPGFMSFIGGSVDASDAELPIEGGEEAERVRRACAIREAFEEAGALVALAAPVDPAPLAQARHRLLEGSASFPDLARENGWRFRSDGLAFAGRWKSPPFRPTRFDTNYYLARVPDDEKLSVIPGELARGEWVRPLDAIRVWRDGQATFAAPILWTLITLAEGAANDAELAAQLAMAPARSGKPVRRIELKWGIVLHPMKTSPLPPATHTNAYLVGEREVALIDPGSGEPDEVRDLFALIEALESEGRKLTTVLLTHFHPDHIGGLEAVRAKRKVRVAAHAETARHVAVDVTLADGDWVPLTPGHGDWTLRVLHTPGHTRGHLCFLHPRTRSLFTGDHIPGGTGTVIIDPPEGDMAAYLASLERLTREDIDTIFPGHGAPQGGAQRRIRGLIRHRLEREAKVLAALSSEPRPLAALVESAYADTTRELWPYAERSLLAHLLKLEAEGRAKREGERWARAA